MARLSLRDKLFVVSMCTALLVMTSTYAMMVTFFPIDATERGMSAYAISLIFTAFDIGKLVTSCFAGQLASRYGRRVVLTWGAMQVATFGCCIGLTPRVAPTNLTTMTILFTGARALQGSGVALASLAIFAILGDAFPANRGLVVGSASSMLALGYFVGPPVGGLLYTLSGFCLPFVALSGLVVLCTLPILWLYPSERADTKALTTADAAAAAHEAASADEAQLPPAPAAEAPSAPTTQPSWRLVLQLPLDVWVTSATALLYMSKWGWWDIYFTSWLVAEFDASIQSASVHISMIALVFAITGPASGAMGDRLGERRMVLAMVSMGVLAVVYTGMGPWQLHVLSPAVRRVSLYLYLALDGFVCCLLEPQLMPQMLASAERAAAGTGPDEHLTNVVTSIGQTAMNLGGVLGPFVAVPIIEASGFRGALAVWAVPFAVLACGSLFHRMSCLWRRRHPASTRPASAKGAPAASGSPMEELPRPTQED